jgi:hypothetical protein
MEFTFSFFLGLILGASLVILGGVIGALKSKRVTGFFIGEIVGLAVAILIEIPLKL